MRIIEINRKIFENLDKNKEPRQYTVTCHIPSEDSNDSTILSVSSVDKRSVLNARIDFGYHDPHHRIISTYLTTKMSQDYVAEYDELCYKISELAGFANTKSGSKFQVVVEDGETGETTFSLTGFNNIDEKNHQLSKDITATGTIVFRASQFHIIKCDLDSMNRNDTHDTLAAAMEDITTRFILRAQIGNDEKQGNTAVRQADGNE